jgi:hypothetical protein
VIVDDFDILDVLPCPAKADPVLIIDPDAVASRAIAFERFQPVPRRDSQEVERGRRIELFELAPRNPFDRAEAAHGRPVEQALRIPATE